MGVEQAVTIRRATAADAPALAEVGVATFIETFGHLYTPEDLAAFLADAHSAATYGGMLRDRDVAVWLAEPPLGPVAGYAVAGPCKLPVADMEEKAGEVRRVYLLRAFHNGGLGTRLLVTAMQWLESQNRLPIYVGVWSQNYGAQRLYQRFGFTKVGEYDFPVGRHLDREFILKQARA